MHLIRQRLEKQVRELPSKKRPNSVPASEDELEMFRLSEETKFASAIAADTKPSWVGVPETLVVLGTSTRFGEQQVIPPACAYTTQNAKVPDFYGWCWVSQTGTTYNKIVDGLITKILIHKPHLAVGSKVGLFCSLHETVVSTVIDDVVFQLLKSDTDATLEDYRLLYEYRCKMGITLEVADVGKHSSALATLPLQTYLAPKALVVSKEPTPAEDLSTQRTSKLSTLKMLISERNYKFFIHAPYNYNAADVKPHDSIMIRELKDAVSVGALGVVMHVGHSTIRTTLPESVFMDRMLTNFKKLLLHATITTPLLLETPPGKEQELCTTPSSLAWFYEQLSADEASKSGLVVDTCHVFDAGYDPLVFLEYLHVRVPGAIKLIHFNDSAGPCGCRRDIHASPGGGFTILKNIVTKCELPTLTFAGEEGRGYIGIKRLVAVAKWAELHNIPCIVE